MDIQRNFIRNLIQEFFSFQHPLLHNQLPYRHNHLSFNPILVTLVHPFFLFRRMDHHRLHRIHSIVILHHHHP